MNIQKRLKKLRLEQGLTQKELANKIGKSYQIYQTWENGSRNPKDENLRQLADALNVSFEYLTDTEILPIYQKLSDDNKQQTINYAEDKLKSQNEEDKVIQLNNSLIPYEVEEEQALSAGYGEGYTQEYGKEIVYWNQQVKHDRAIIIRGNSMEPDYHYGQIALIRYQNCVDVPGGIYAVDDIERGLAYIKSVYMEDEHIRLVSLNDEEDFEGNRLFPDILLPRNENTRIIGKVVDAFTPIEKNFL